MDDCKHAYTLKTTSSGKYNCAITGKYCIASVDNAMEPQGHKSQFAKFCPAYNLEKDLAKTLI